MSKHSDEYRKIADQFYSSQRWRELSTMYMKSRHYICERCGGVAEICHHKRHLNSHNIGDPSVALNQDNLEALCRDCHNKEHFLKHTITKFDDDGNVSGVKKSAEEIDFEKAREGLTRLLKKMTAQNRQEDGSRSSDD